MCYIIYKKKYIFVKKFFDRSMQRKCSNNYESYNNFFEAKLPCRKFLYVDFVPVFQRHKTKYQVNLEGFGHLSQYGGIKVFDGSQCSNTLNKGVKIGDIPDYTILLNNGTQVPINQLY